MKASVPRSWLVVVAAILLTFLAACSSSKQPTDAQIIGDVVTRIQASPQVTKKDVAVASQNGVVTLRGTVPSDNERNAVAGIASQAPGVKTVINDLFIDGPATSETQQPAADPQIQSPAPEPKPEPSVARSSKPSAYKKSADVAKDTVTKSQTTTKTTTASTSTPQNNLPIVYEGGPSSISTGSSTAASNGSSTAAQQNVVTVPALPAIPSTPAVKPVQLVRVPSGTNLSVRLIDTIDSDRNQVGDTFRGTLDSPIYAEDQEVIPAGASVAGKVTQLENSGRFTGRPQIALELTSLSVNGRNYNLQTNQYTKQGSSQGSRTAKSVGGGAALGALIGAIAGGGKGAAIGAAVGAGAGGGVEAARGRQQIHLGSETRLNFSLANSISVAPVSNIDRGSNNDYQSSASVYKQRQQQRSNDSTYNDTYSNDEPTPVDPPDGDRPVLKRRPQPSNPPN
ncbi:MAG TPA: BON domain-containing protein [Terriglobales bacterium]|nr:BON domain-containing protein [Terriglobales bacterium]